MVQARGVGQLSGKQWQPRDIAHVCYDAGWLNVRQLAIAVAVCLAESQGFDHASNDNTKLLSDLTKDQIVANVETYEKMTVVDPVGGVLRYLTEGTTDIFPTTTEWITSRDVGAFEINIPASKIGSEDEDKLYDFLFNVSETRRLWLQWSNNGKDTETGWNHWAAFKNNIAQNPESKGRYIHKAVRGVGNFLADYQFHIPNPPLLYYKDGAKYPL